MKVRITKEVFENAVRSVAEDLEFCVDVIAQNIEDVDDPEMKVTMLLDQMIKMNLLDLVKSGDLKVKTSIGEVCLYAVYGMMNQDGIDIAIGNEKD